MLHLFSQLLRRARLRGLTEGPVQRARAEVNEVDAKDDAERWQDYGFAAQPVSGEGLVMHVAGHTIVLRMDRLAERPELAQHEVCVWHKDGHRVTLKAGRLVQVDCTELVVNASAAVRLNTPLVQVSTRLTVPTAQAATSLTIAGKELRDHVHGGVEPGAADTGPNE